MVWFQCEDCGENLKKPKLQNHFRICSAFKLSCIDCSKTFDRSTVQSHTQCISEAEKYGPKDQGNATKTPQSKPDKTKAKPNADVDINVGLSSRPPWFCSLCNTKTTSQQTLSLHADGKKHRAKAKAFHASQKQSDQIAEPTSKMDIDSEKSLLKSSESNVSVTAAVINGEILDKQISKKRKVDESDGMNIEDMEKPGDCSNGEVIQAKHLDSSQKECKKKMHSEDYLTDKNEKSKTSDKIKWKKLVTTTLKSTPDGIMKIKKLQKMVIETLEESGVTEDKAQLCQRLMDKVNSSSRFVVDDKKIWLVSKA